MIQPGFFDPRDRLYKIDKNGEPPTRINETVDWEMFRPALEKARDKGRKSLRLQESYCGGCEAQAD